MEAKRRAAVAKVRQLLDEHPERLSPLSALRLSIDILGTNAVLDDASQYMAHYARSQGYNLPAYALAGCGEIREFLADNGVSNVPQWYALIGFGPELYQRIYEYQLLVVMNGSYQRQAIPIHALWWEKAAAGGLAAQEAFDLALYCLDFAMDKRSDPEAVLF